MTFRKLVHEPLFHFLGIGLLLFGLYALVSPADTGGEKIVISRPMVDALKAQHETLWGRAPTEAELNVLIETRVAEEILYREGLSMGLDRDDAVIKRRVRQKYELIAEEEDSVSPSEADLASYLKANAERFRAPPIVGFTQVMVPDEGSTSDVEVRATTLKAALAAGADPATTGKATLLPGRIEQVALDLIARDFGERFAAALETLPEGQWEGPVPSAYGLHLVRIDRRSAAEAPPLEAVRGDVQREWENARRLRAREARMADLRTRYTVEVEDPTAP